MHNKNTYRVLYVLKKPETQTKSSSPKNSFSYRTYIYLQHYYVIIYYLIYHVNTVNKREKNNAHRKM